MPAPARPASAPRDHEDMKSTESTRLATGLTSTDTQTARRYRTESNVAHDLARVIEGLEYGPVEHEYASGKGRIDIYVPHRRVIIEVKARGLAADPDKPQTGTGGESPREQVDRYVRSEIQKELESFDWDPSERSKHPWTGVVTDGRSWHAWRYAHALNAKAEVLSSTSADRAASLIEALENAFGTEQAAKQWVPTAPAGLFREHATALRELYRQLPPNVQGTTETKRRLWLEMLRVSGIAPDDDNADQLFVTHTLLIAIARIVTHTLTPQATDWKNTLKDGFVSWIADSRTGVEWADGLRRTIEDHDWKRRRHDVMQSLYMSFVPAADRKVFGEYYTPDWLAALIVREALDDAWRTRAIEKAESAVRTGTLLERTGVLDPTCGSGTFLYHAARHILDAPEMNQLQPVQRADITASLVHGIDVHPVAVEIAKANMMRVLPTAPTMGSAAVQVRMGDSLMTDDKAASLFEIAGAMRIWTPKGREILLPMGFVRRHTFADDMGRVVVAAVQKTPVPQPVLNTLEPAERKGLEAARDALAKAVEDEGNSVWTWYAVNIAAPKLLAERKVDRIVANPPWVKLSDIQHEGRKRVMEEFGQRLSIYQGGKQAPHTDIAAFFIQRARELYLQDPDHDPAIWLVKKSSLKAGQWAAFREMHRERLAQSIDLEDLQPFGSGDATRCCLLLEHRPMAGAAEAKELAAVRKIEQGTNERADRPRPEETPETALDRIRFIPRAERPPRAASGYVTQAGKGLFRQGATVLPHVLTIAERSETTTDPARVRVTTRESTQGRWRSVDVRTIEIPKHWLTELCTTNNVAAFATGTATVKAIIPLDGTGQLVAERNIEEDGWLLLDELYRTHVGAGKGTPRTLLKRIDYLRNLSVQLPLRAATPRKLVLHPKSGDIMRAARDQAGRAVVDDSLYWYHARSSGEAAYLTVLLNTPCLQEAYSEARESGRDFHLHVWRKVPIPRYDKTIRLHREIAALCRRSEKIAASTVKEELDQLAQKGQVALSKAVRSALNNCGIEAAMNVYGRQLLPEHAR